MENIRFLAVNEASTNNIERFVAKSFGYSMNEETGIAKIYAQGALHDLGSWWTFSQGSYSMLRVLIEELVNADSVKGIVLHLNSPGGYVDGCFEACQFIREARESKPIWAYGEGMVCSAAYALASSCTKFYASPSTEVGSVGVQCQYTDASEMMKKAGIISKIFRSKNAENKNLSPDTEEGKKQIQESLDYHEGLFYEAISLGRDVEVDVAIDTYGHGRTFVGQELLSRKMVDGLCQYNEFIEYFTSSLGESEGEEMDITKLSSEEKKNLYEALLQNDPSLSAERDRSVLETERNRISALVDIRTEANASIVDAAISEGRTAESVALEVLKIERAAAAKTPKADPMKEIEEMAEATQPVEVPQGLVGILDTPSEKAGLEAIEFFKTQRNGGK